MKFKINFNYLVIGLIKLLAYLLLGPKKKRNTWQRVINLIPRIKFALICVLLCSAYLICHDKLIGSVSTKSIVRLYFEVTIF